MTDHKSPLFRTAAEILADAGIKTTSTAEGRMLGGKEKAA